MKASTWVIVGFTEMRFDADTVSPFIEMDSQVPTFPYPPRRIARAIRHFLPQIRNLLLLNCPQTFFKPIEMLQQILDFLPISGKEIPFLF